MAPADPDPRVPRPPDVSREPILRELTKSSQGVVEERETIRKQDPTPDFRKGALIPEGEE